MANGDRLCWIANNETFICLLCCTLCRNAIQCITRTHTRKCLFFFFMIKRKRCTLHTECNRKTLVYNFRRWRTFQIANYFISTEFCINYVCTSFAVDVPFDQMQFTGDKARTQTKKKRNKAALLFDVFNSLKFSFIIEVWRNEDSIGYPNGLPTSFNIVCMTFDDSRQLLTSKSSIPNRNMYTFTWTIISYSSIKHPLSYLNCNYYVI